MEEGERHHLKRRVVQMEIVPNLFACGKAVHKDHPRWA
jgi:hypothetical protein